jgi:hypothetical protein
MKGIVFIDGIEIGECDYTHGLPLSLPYIQVESIEIRNLDLKSWMGKQVSIEVVGDDDRVFWERSLVAKEEECYKIIYETR